MYISSWEFDIDTMTSAIINLSTYGVADSGRNDFHIRRPNIHESVALISNVDCGL